MFRCRLADAAHTGATWPAAGWWNHAHPPLPDPFMSDSRNSAEAFRRFMQTVNGLQDSTPLFPDPDDVRISELEREVRALQRSVRRLARRRQAAVLRVQDADS